MNMRTLREAIQKSDNVVFFGGAGTSTESGIPDFRSARGIYRGATESTASADLSPEEILSASSLERHPQLFFQFYREHLIHREALPNRAHQVLARWEDRGIIRAVVTQNIDGLHQRAGSRCVHELHGSVWRNYCQGCGRRYTLDETLGIPGAIPRCAGCNAVVRPDVVLFGEMLDDSVVEAAIDAISNAEILIVAGSSLVVYPAAGFLDYYRGNHLVLINRDPTPFDRRAQWVFRRSIGEVLTELDSG